MGMRNSEMTHENKPKKVAHRPTPCNKLVFSKNKHF
jgi:hypothetical protein